VHPLFIFSTLNFIMRRQNRKEEYHSLVEFEFNDFLDPKALISELIAKIGDLAKNKEFDTFAIGFSWPKISEEELLELKKSVQYKLIAEIESKYDKKVDFEAYGAYFLVDFNKKEVLLRLKSLFVKGNYCKFSRKIAQTTHFCRRCRGKGCNGCTNGLESEESVEQLLALVFLPELAAMQLKFHGAGREDVDVLMLGKGRPFIVEILQPEIRSLDLEKLCEKVNKKFEGKISINSLEIVPKSEVAIVKNNVHEKIYLAIVSCESMIEIKKLVLNKKINVSQRTPERVEKRRADLVREKWVTLLKTNPINEKEFELELKTAHGTYVKEFISGDNERSTPSISSMLEVKCVCKQLDVLEIC